ncbi:hypothetical protein TRFO_40476 [Tritrichomonas foetus]|uniref:Uncharacterized protein n=1 Tax=Tritrichomonas foetus TaxID=1144522 RepID=A0A1J4J7N5_9EUKA|nr:hypothetical protein TRFO_40476 [Tritrichomonas foetus]|eukprot:OHS93228.1 hypothetical protein TRFO_40476 [Tritrichomonas foetus]
MKEFLIFYLLSPKLTEEKINKLDYQSQYTSKEENMMIEGERTKEKGNKGNIRRHFHSQDKTAQIILSDYIKDFIESISRNEKFTFIDYTNIFGKQSWY